jgi:hypothetical protein
VGPFYLSRPSHPTPLPCPHGPASQPLPCPQGLARPISLFTPRAHDPKIIPRADRWAKPASALAHTTRHCRVAPTCQRISSTSCVFRVTDMRGLGHCSSPKRVTTAGRQLQPPYPGAIGQLACARPVIRSLRCRRFDPRVPGPTSKLSPRAPAQMGRREMEREGGGGERELGGDRRKRGNRRPSCLSRAQVGCACSRGLQASAREGARGLCTRRLVLPRAANLL